MDTDKVRENRLRRMAERQGLVVKKSRRRDPRALDFGTYAIIDASRNVLLAGDRHTGYGLDLDEVEAWLVEDREEQAEASTEIEEQVTAELARERHGDTTTAEEAQEIANSILAGEKAEIYGRIVGRIRPDGTIERTRRS